MNQPDIKIGSCNSCNLEFNYIALGQPMGNKDILPDKELHKYYSDTLTHEFIHLLLFKMHEEHGEKIADVVSSLWDVIGDTFRVYDHINKYRFEIGRWTPWSVAIKEFGIQYLFNKYYITDSTVMELRELQQQNKI